MSVADRQLRFTPRAERDIRNTLLDTRRQWGAEQRTIYRRKLNNAFSLIRNNPEIGLARGDIGPAIRFRLVERHVIHSEIHPDAILILRLMHVRMAVPSGPDDLDHE
jgi:plasmid stabilization system protein ParE